MFKRRRIIALTTPFFLAAVALGQTRPRHWCTALGGSDRDTITEVTAAPNGDIIVAGWTFSSSFPVTPGAYQGTRAGHQDAFVARLSADGSQLLKSTFFGGSNLENVSFLHMAGNGSI